MRYFMGIDNGGTMTKAAVFDEVGKEIAVSAQDTPLLTPKEGYNERDMLELWKTNAECIQNVLKKAGIDPAMIVGVGCTGHGKGLYLWGKDGKPACHAIASTDRRAADIVAGWEADGTVEKAQMLALQPVIACQPVALLAWLKRHRPEMLPNIQWIFEAKDYIRFMLTGIARAEATDYSGACLMNLKTRRFDRDLLNLFEIGELYDCLPPLCQSYELCGTVTEAAAALTGLKAGTPVCGGMFDIDACAVAMDVTRPEQLCVITGTWSINEYPSSQPVRPDTTTHNSLFCLPDTYLIEESSPTSAGNLDWYCRHFLKWEKEQAKQKGRRFYDEIDALVEQLPPNESDVLFLPFLYGSNADNCENAAFVGLSNCHSAAHMLRAIFEGVVFSHLYHIEKLLQFREPPKTVRLAGGAANSAVWVQMFADALGIPVEVVLTKELGAQGCAMAAALAAGVYPDYPVAAKAMVHIARTVQPNAENTVVYRRKYERYKKLMTLLGELPC